MKKMIARCIGAFFALIGIIGMMTPIPFGIIFFIIGLFFLIPTTPEAATLVRAVRQRIGLFDRVMQAATDRMPYPYRRILRQTEVSEWR